MGRFEPPDAFDGLLTDALKFGALLSQTPMGEALLNAHVQALSGLMNLDRV
jgi:hypothetical protein